MKKRSEWKFKKYNTEDFDRLKKSMPQVKDYLIQLFTIRNLKTFEEAKQFANPHLDDLHDPFLLSDIKKAIREIQTAIKERQKILIYGDYDVDGTTSVAMIWEFLNYLHHHTFQEKEKRNLSFYIPNRFTEGYGVSTQAIQKAIEEEIQLIITVDCGIKDNTAIEMAKNAGIKVIICDHHEPGLTIPPATAVLNPKKPNCTYPFKELSGCGVAFKLIQGLLYEYNLPKEKAYDYLDYVVISTIADVVSLTGENRILALKGLEKMNQSPAEFVQALRSPEVLSHQQKISAVDIGFKIAPLINAAGRMKDASTAVEFFIAPKNERQRILEELSTLNKNRRSIDQNISREANEILKNNPIQANNKSIVLFNKDWHIGTVGIVASRMIEKYYKPTFILTEIEKGIYSGSGRSIKGLNLVNVLEKQSDKLISFGGHYFAAGLRIEEQHLESFAQKFENDVEELLKEEDMIPILEIDAELNIQDINEQLLNTLNRFEPCGQDNPSPIFITKNLPLKDIHQEFIRQEHLKLHIKQPFTTTRLVAMGFNLAQQFKTADFNSQDKMDLVYEITENHFKGKRSIQLRIIDLKKSQEESN